MIDIFGILVYVGLPLAGYLLRHWGVHLPGTAPSSEPKSNPLHNLLMKVVERHLNKPNAVADDIDAFLKILEQLKAANSTPAK